MRIPTLAKARAALERAARIINRLTQRNLKVGKPIPYGVLTPPTPNTVLGRTPDPFTGGN